MKTGEVLELLKISRGTLTKYVNQGLIKARLLDNGRYEYDPASVEAVLRQISIKRTCIYARVSTPELQKELDQQVAELKEFCQAKGYIVSGVYSDVAKATNFNRQKSLMKLMDEVLKGQIERVVIFRKDRLARVNYEMFTYLFGRYGCEIEVVDELLENDPEMEEEELMAEVSEYLRGYSGELCNSRKIRKVKDVLEGQRPQRVYARRI